VTEIWALAALWLGLALVATLVSIWLRVATALSEIHRGKSLFQRLLLGSVSKQVVQYADRTVLVVR
jgi:nucleotide-binding universal stress UspA family protein